MIQPDLTSAELEAAILQTVTYSDLFDFPLTAVEIQRYLHETVASLDQIEALLPRINGRLHHHASHYFLPNREETVAIRQRRGKLAQHLWPLARKHGRLLANIPFVRMVAVTGSLAVGNPDREADIDYLVVTENGRLWLCRAFTILLVRLAERRGLTLCPNYFLTENALRFPEENIYTAHELAQMVPLAGHDIYQQIRAENGWIAAFLPNAVGAPPLADSATEAKRPLWQRAIESLLRLPLIDRLEAWEMARKIRKFQQTAVNFNEADFSPTRCKGHFDGHQHQTLNAYSAHVRKINRKSKTASLSEE